MSSRHRSRQRALQTLYLWDMRRMDPEQRVDPDQAIDGFYNAMYSEDEGTVPPLHDEFMRELVHGVVDNLGPVDELIARHAENWRIERMPAVDRNILRLGVYEMLKMSTPGPVAIDEALELARKFAGDESVHFINGVLDAVRKSLPPPPEGPA